MDKVIIKDFEVVSDDFLYWLFISDEFNKYLCSTATGTKVLHTSPTKIESFSFNLPPLSEQRKIAAILSNVDEKLEAEREHRAQLETVKRGLMQDLLTGRVRVEVDGHD